MLREAERPGPARDPRLRRGRPARRPRGVIDAGRVVQEGTPGELAAAPRSAFVADFTGAVVLTGHARAGPGRAHAGGARRRRHGDQHRRRGGPRGGQRLPLGDRDRAGRRGAAPGSAQNRVEAEVVSITQVGNRVRSRPRRPASRSPPRSRSRPRARLELSQGCGSAPPGRPAATRAGRQLRSSRQQQAQRAVQHLGALPLEEVAGALARRTGPTRSGNAASMRAGSRAGSRGPRGRTGSASASGSTSKIRGIRSGAWRGPPAYS